MIKFFRGVLYTLAGMGLFLLGTYFGAFYVTMRIVQSGQCTLEQLEKVFPL